MKLNKSAIKIFQDKILLWYRDNQRDLPWRKTRDPYPILVSEVMSQQTQLGRVIPKYNAWIKRFPTVTQLAEASLHEVLRYWSGLGYNSRALNLQKTAKVLVNEYSSSEKNESRSSRQARTIRWPRTVIELIELPGIGKYTASAIACFAFDVQIPVVDTNIRKVITHEFFNGQLPEEKVIEEIAYQILPKNRAYEWNQALMDYSSLVLKDKKIPVPKQSHFLTSDRYFRGQTVKLLLEVASISFTGLQDYFAERNPVEPSRFEQILESMVKDGLIVYYEGKLSLPA
ncbi:MAG: hypothetical protein AAB478_00380 [Patescibacteria group bacterium]